MDNLLKAKQFVIDYFNKHDLDEEDEKIHENEIELLYYSKTDDKWKIVFVMPYNLIYVLETTNKGNVYFSKYTRIGFSLYQWKDDD